jgi:hemerythrin-like domain-containing protein
LIFTIGTMKHEPHDPLRELLHDHGQLGRLVLAVGSAMTRIENGETDSDGAVTELIDGVDSLREALFVHFARENEILFPFVENQLPAFEAQVGQLRSEHDAVCARAVELTRAVDLASRDGVGFATCVSRFEAFVELYGKHAHAEQELLQHVDSALGAGDREVLRDLLATL